LLNSENELSKANFDGQRKGSLNRGADWAMPALGIFERVGPGRVSVVVGVSAATLLKPTVDRGRRGCGAYTDSFESNYSLMLRG
jgi:hypothetical protein